METNKSYGDKGIKAVGLISLFCIPFMNFGEKMLIHYLLIVIGAAYCYFAYHKFNTDRRKGKGTDRALGFIIMGSFIFICGVIMFVLQYMCKDVFV